VTRRLSPFALLSHTQGSSSVARGVCLDMLRICFAFRRAATIHGNYIRLFRKIFKGTLLCLSVSEKSLRFGLAKLMELNMFFLLLSSVPGNSDFSRRRTMASSHM
jgi:hypothetical protein